MKKIKRLIYYFFKLGIFNFFHFLVHKIFKIKSNKYNIYKFLIKNKNGIEIGGPTNLFKKNGFLPIYNDLNNLDGVNYSSKTLWSNLDQGKNYKFSKLKENGNQFICDAIDLNIIKSSSYDFLISCNNLEHIANPIKALVEWLRIIKRGGILILILPNNLINFDHKRKVTDFNHLINDYNNDIEENDMTHLDEVLKLHDLKLDPELKNFEEFKKRCKNNFENRAMHHHVYDLKLLSQIFKFLKLEILLMHSTFTDHYIVGKKIN
jgi:SAM-dependent methyltransferase